MLFVAGDVVSSVCTALDVSVEFVSQSSEMSSSVGPISGGLLDGCSDGGSRLSRIVAGEVVIGDVWVGSSGTIDMPRYRVGVDRALTVLGRNDDQCRLVEPILLERFYHVPDGYIGELDFTEQRLARRADIVEIAALHRDRLFDELLADADHLEVHSEHAWNRPAILAAVILAVDLVNDSLNFQVIVTLDVSETVGPRTRVCGVRGPDRKMDCRAEVVILPGKATTFELISGE